MTVGKHCIAGRTKTCPSPSFDARNLKNAKWSSTEEINQTQGGRDLNFKEIPKTWTPRNQPSPSTADKDFKKINFDTGSLKRVQRSVSSDSAYTSSDPKETFAWKDSTLDRKLKDLHAKKYSDAPEPKHTQNDNSLARTLENWKQTPLPKIEDPDVLLLKKARQEKKVKRYLEDNFKNRQGGYSECENDTEIGALQAKYFTLDHPTTGSPPRSPPPYSRGQSRFEREQNIKVGSLDSFSPCAPRQKSLSPPPSASSAQARYERERFRVQPGRIEDYRPGRCSVNEKRSTTPSAGGCSITKYSSAHSFNPILNSKSEHNISVRKESDSSSNRERNLERKLSGYESDSSLSFRKHNYNPQTAPKSVKNIYNSIQKGGDVPMNGLKMSENGEDTAPLLFANAEEDTTAELIDTQEIDDQITADFKESPDNISATAHIPDVYVEPKVILTAGRIDDESAPEIVAGPLEDVINDCAVNNGDTNCGDIEDFPPPPPPEVDNGDDPGYYIITEERATNCPSILDIDLIDPSKKKDCDQSMVKRWSKLLKHSLPSKSHDKDKDKDGEGKKKSSPKERKSLKDKMKENDFVQFLSERRAVSESRFKVQDIASGSGGKNPNHVIRTNSEQSIAAIEPFVDNSVRAMAKDFDAKHEEDIDFTEQSVAAANTSANNGKVNDNEEDDTMYSKSSTSSSTKINELSQDDERRKKRLEVKERKRADRREKKEKRKPCTTCATPEEHKEHRKERRKAKKEKEEKKDKDDQDSVKRRTKSEEKVIQKSTIKSDKVTGDNFFQKLLIKEYVDKPKAERPSRPRTQTKNRRPYVKTSQPSLGAFLKSKQAVSDSIFKHYDQMEKYLENKTLPRGVIQNDDSPQRSSLFPRSVSNLEKSRIGSAERANSALSNISDVLDKRAYSLPRPLSSLSQRSDASMMVDQVEYRNYVYEMINSTPKNPRFCQLQDYFNTLDKVMTLENAASKMEIHKLTSEDIMDFDTWRQMRKKEKAKDELDGLLSTLKGAQKEREFLFRVKDKDDYKWRGDSRLDSRDRSVENLRAVFSDKEGSGHFDLSNSLPRSFAVQNGWLKLKENEGKKQPDAFSSYPSTKENSYMNSRSRSSLSNDQVIVLKDQLNDILSNRGSNASSAHSSRSPSRHDFAIEVTDKAKPLQNLFVRPVPEIVKKSVQEAERSVGWVGKIRSRSREEEERMKLSKTINDELMKRVNFKETKPVPQYKVPMMLLPQIGQTEKKKPRDQSPRVCYSLENEDVHKENDDFILVLSDDDKKNDAVSEIVDKWASCDSEDEFRVGRRKRKGRLGNAFSQSSDSISSGTSMHTVIYQPPKDKLDIIPIKEVHEAEAKAEKEQREYYTVRPKNDEPEKTVREIKNEFESISCATAVLATSIEEDVNDIPPNKVKEIRKSFESMPFPLQPSDDQIQSKALASPPKVPARTSSFNKAISNGKCKIDLCLPSPRKTNLDKDSPQSKSTSSIPENLNDEGYASYMNSPRKTAKNGTYLEKNYIPEKSISNIDLTDNENNSLDETFGKMHEKVHSIRQSTEAGKTGLYISRTLPLKKDGDSTRHSRAYLLASKVGDVKEKMLQFEPEDSIMTKSLPIVNADFIKNHVTDTTKVVIKNQEMANVDQIRSRLERCASKADEVLDCGAGITKGKIKHFCKKVGHSKILTKMSALQKSGKVDEDAGFNKLSTKASAEDEYFKKYQSGGVEGMKSMFEGPTFSIHVSQKEMPHFRWSQRFEKDLPNPAESYTNAQKQNQFRNYYKYHPSTVPKIPDRLESRMYFKNLKDLTSAGSRNPVYCPITESKQDQSQALADNHIAQSSQEESNNEQKLAEEENNIDNNNLHFNRPLSMTNSMLPCLQDGHLMTNSMISSLQDNKLMTNSMIARIQANLITASKMPNTNTDEPSSLPVFRLDAMGSESVISVPDDDSPMSLPPSQTSIKKKMNNISKLIAKFSNRSGKIMVLLFECV